MSLAIISGCANIQGAVPKDAQSVNLPDVVKIKQTDSEGNRIEKINVNLADQTIHTIHIDPKRWEGERAVYIDLPYQDMEWANDPQRKPFTEWDPIVEGGPPALVVREYISGGSAPGTHRWTMRIFLWEHNSLRELPPISGSGEIYYFKDLNKDGTLEFVNQEALPHHDMSAGGLPLSPRVYRFKGNYFEPETQEETWPIVILRIKTAYH